MQINYYLFDMQSNIPIKQFSFVFKLAKLFYVLKLLLFVSL